MTLCHQAQVRLRTSASSRSNQVRDSFANRPRLEHRRVPALRALLVRGGPHHDESAERHERATQPNPTDERIECHADLGAISSANAGEDDVDVLLERSHDSDFCRRLERRDSARIDVLPLLAGDDARRLPIARHIERDRRDFAIQDVVPRDPLTEKGPTMSPRVGHRLRVAGVQRQIELALEREPGECREHNDDAEVDDVPAVAPAISRDQPWQRDYARLAVHVMPGVHALVEFLDDRSDHERAERVRQERREVMHAERKKQNPDRRRSRHRNQELPLEVGDRRAPPRDQRSDPGQQQQ